MKKHHNKINKQDDHKNLKGVIFVILIMLMITLLEYNKIPISEYVVYIGGFIMAAILFASIKALYPSAKCF